MDNESASTSPQVKPVRSRIVQLTAENVKRLHAVQITPKGNLVVVGGRNGQGKTSVLDSIAMALGGADEAPAMPVRRGEEKARIVLDLGDIIVRRTFTTKDGATTTSLVVENKDKMRASAPQSILEKLTGKVTFDPLAFVNMEPDQKAATLKRLVGLDLSDLDSRRQRLYSERTLIGRDHDRENSRLGLMPVHSDVPTEEQSVAEIAAEMEAANTNNRTCEIWARDVGAAKTGVDNAEKIVAAVDRDIAETEARLVKLRQQRQNLQGDVERAVKALIKCEELAKTRQPIDVGPIRQKLANVEALNAKVRANKARATAAKSVEVVGAKYDELTKAIIEIDRQKDERLAATKFPIPGLSFDKATGAVLFGGVPFDQASAAERLRVSVAIAAAMNPRLRVMLVRDASLLDDDGLAQLAKLAEEFDLQVWAERVGKGAECSVIIEDGSVQKKPGDETMPLPIDKEAA